MIEWLKQTDQELFLWLNGLHAAWLDLPMEYITGREMWIPLYVALAIWLIFKQKQDALWSIIYIILSVALADQLTSGLMKPFFERLRPCHDPAISHLVYTVAGCGGKYGFASSHASTTFALALSVSLLHAGRKQLALLLFSWASIISYSRIYVGVHYPGDLLTGAIVGVIIAAILYQVGVRTGRLKQV